MAESEPTLDALRVAVELACQPQNASLSHLVQVAMTVSLAAEFRFPKLLSVLVRGSNRRHADCEMR